MLNIYIDMGNRYLMENERNEKLRGYYAKFRKSLTGVRELLNSNSEIISELTNSFDNLNKLANTSAQQLENTNETVKLIQNIALNTRILGFNASIEASRAKESGKGFGVIAQEVRSLADVSKSSAEKIEEIVDNITEISEEMRATILETNETVKTAFDNMNSMTSVLEAMSDIAKELN
jgi:methyl-accepting chemotaxis protein